MDPLATVGELEIYLGRTLDDQAQAEAALTLASGAVRAYCGWDLSLQTETMHFEGAQNSLITLPTLELLDITETRADGITLDPAEFTINWSRKGQVWGCWVYRTQYEFDVEHGYDPIPDVLKLVTMDLSQRQLSNPEGLTSATVGQVTKTWGSSSTTTGNTSGMSTLHSSLLDRYSI
jgi:hypothetical protein